jgi:hypothetical protein
VRHERRDNDFFVFNNHNDCYGGTLYFGFHYRDSIIAILIFRTHLESLLWVIFCSFFNIFLKSKEQNHL